MFLYLFLFCAILIYVISNRLFNNKQARHFLLIIVCLFLSTGYMTGSDWRAYELLYDEATDLSNLSNYDKEIGFFYLFYIFNKIGLEFWPLWILLKIACFYSTIKFLSYYTSGNYKYAFLYFFSYFALFYYIDNPMRNLIAATIFLLAIRLIYERKLLKYIVLLLICSCFHASVLFMAPIYFLGNRKPPSNKIILTIISLVYLVFLFFWNTSLIESVNSLATVLFGREYRGMNYLNQEGIGISAGMLVSIAIYIYILSKKEEILKLNKYAGIMLNFSLIYILTFLIGYFIPIIGRLSMYCFLPYLVCFSYAMQVEKNRTYISLLYVPFVFIVLVKTITTDFRYIPYTSYLEYIFKEKPSYDERSMYNLYKSPYNDN